jgi:hypothetical protein
MWQLSGTITPTKKYGIYGFKNTRLDELDDISMGSYMNCDWYSHLLWHGVGFGLTRLATSKVVMSQ